MPQPLKISNMITADIAPMVNGFFGVSFGQTVSERVEFDTFKGDYYRVAVATKKPFLFASLFFIEKEVIFGKEKKTIWININSFRKRFSHNQEAAKFLIENLPEKFIPGLRNEVSKLPLGNPSPEKAMSGSNAQPSPNANRSNSISSSDSEPLLLNFPFPMGQGFNFNRASSLTDSSDSFSSKPPMPMPPIEGREGKNATPNRENLLYSPVNNDSSSIPLLNDQGRVERIQQTIQKYSSKSNVSDIAKSCLLADKKASELSPETTTAFIAGKDHSLKRSILIGPQENGYRRKFLLLTHVKRGNDCQLGRGAYKKAKFAVDLDSGQIKVVTIAKKSNLSSNQNWDEDKKLLSTELKNTIQAGKNNKDVVQLDFGHELNETRDNKKKTKAEEKHYSIMDYCDNGDLSKNIGNANNLQSHQWTLEIARGLATMHQQGILHRDVKPENIFLQEGHAKIGDLGFSCTTKEAETNGIPGTLHYAAPECFKGQKTSIKSDAWSFGCVVFELLGTKKERLCKERASKQFGGSQESVDRRIEEHIPNATHRELLKGLLTLDPKQRITVEEFYKEFSKIVAPK